MSHFSHTTVYFIKDEEDDNLQEGADNTYSASSEFDEDDEPDAETDEEDTV